MQEFPCAFRRRVVHFSTAKSARTEAVFALDA